MCKSTPALVCRKVKHLGFTLVELMVSIVIGLVMMLALVNVYVNVSSTNSQFLKTNGLLENGRFAMDLIQEDLVHGGFWGGYVPQFDDFGLKASSVPTDYPTIVPDPCKTFSTWDAPYVTALLGIPVQAYATSPSTACDAIVTNKKTNTDVVVVRHAETCLPGEANCEAINNSKVYFQHSLCEAEYAATSPVRYVLGNTAADFILKKVGCTGTPPATVGVVADKRKYTSNLYYIRNYSTTSGDGIPTLMRSTFNLGGASGAPGFETAVPLIEGIEGFAVEFGVDRKSRCNTDANYGAALSFINPATCAVATNTSLNTHPSNRGDGVPELPFVKCTTAAPCSFDQFANTVVVKLYVLARDIQPSNGFTDTRTYTLGTTTLGPFNDGYRRRVFQTSVRLNNVSGRRVTP